jgi:CheY-like chemotaxis protein
MMDLSEINTVRTPRTADASQARSSRLLKRYTMSTIMLVDDSATILLSISSILGKAGYTVEKAPNAEEALKKFNNGTKVDLLITDLNMPGMNGIELIREVRGLPSYKFMRSCS